MRRVSLSLLVFFSVALPVAKSAQQKTIALNRQTTSRDVRIVKHMPHVFIRFEREGKMEPLYSGESYERIWLRLHNNSRWKILLCSSPVPKSYGDAELEYEIERYRGSGDTPSTGSSDSCSYLMVGSRKSIVFSIPREHLAKGLAIKLSFRYEWERDPDGSFDIQEPTHWVYFYSGNVLGYKKS